MGFIGGIKDALMKDAADAVNGSEAVDPTMWSGCFTAVCRLGGNTKSFTLLPVVLATRELAARNLGYTELTWTQREIKINRSKAVILYPEGLDVKVLVWSQGGYYFYGFVNPNKEIWSMVVQHGMFPKSILKYI